MPKAISLKRKLLFY